MKIKRMVAWIIAVLLIGGLLSGCQSSKPEENKEPQGTAEPAPTKAGEKQFVSIAANPVGQAGYQWAAAIADLVNKNSSNINATAEETKGYMENARLLIEGGAETGFANNILLNQAYNAAGDFEGAKANQVNAVMAISPIIMHAIVMENSDIKSFEDAKGKRVGIGQPGGSSLVDVQRLIEAFGYTEADFKVFKVNLAEQIDMLKNGQLDMVVWNGSVPLPAVTELVTTKDVRFVPIPDEVSAKVIEKYPSYFEIDLPVDTYPGITEAVNSYGLENVYMARADVPEETIYEITKLIMENLDSLRKVHPSFNYLSKDSVLTGLNVPLHPGALRYYKEAGIPGIDEYVEKYQK